MSPRRIAALAALIIAIGGAVAIAKPKSFLPSTIGQTPNTGPEQPARSEQSPRSKQGEPGWLKDLNLSTEQVEKIQVIRRQYKDRMGQQRQAMRQAQQELRDLMAGDASDEQIRQKYSQVRDLRQQFADAQFNSMLETRKVLNAEQRRKFADRMQDSREKFKEHRYDRLPRM